MAGFVLIWPISAALVYLGMSAIIIGPFPVALLGAVEIITLGYLLSELFSYSSARRARRAAETRPENQQ
jgi:membrane protein implicated in regulation of membrane protease activity